MQAEEKIINEERTGRLRHGQGDRLLIAKLDMGVDRWEKRLEGSLLNSTVPTHTIRMMPPGKHASIFCFSTCGASLHELRLVGFQLANGLGIFDCDEYSVLSGRRVHLGQAKNGSSVHTVALDVD